MKKILFIQHGFGYGGATKSLLIMQKTLFNSFKLYAITQEVSKQSKALIEDFKKYSEVVEYNFPSLYSYSADTISEKGFSVVRKFYPSEIIDFINLNKIDIVHINSTLFSHLLKPIKDKTNAKIIIHLREMLPNQNTEISQYIINNHIKYADAIIAISNNEIQYYPQSNKITVLPNPHEFHLTDSILKTNELDSIVIGMCADFLEYKGHLNFLEMAYLVNKEINEKYPVKFKIIGYPKFKLSFKGTIKYLLNYGYKNKFNSKIKKLGLKNLEVIPFTLNINKEINDLSIYVRPDHTGHPWGRDIIEAMAMKKPIVATGSSEFFVENDKTGYLVPPKNSQAIATKIVKLIREHELRMIFGERAYTKVKDMCDVEKYGNNIKELYKKLITNGYS